MDIEDQEQLNICCCKECEGQFVFPHELKDFKKIVYTLIALNIVTIASYIVLRLLQK